VPVQPFNAHIPDVRALASSNDIRGLVRIARYARRKGARDAAAEALGVIGEPAVAMLVAALADTQGDTQGESISHALYLIGSSAAPELIACMLGAPDATVRSAAAYILSHFEDSRVGPAAMRALDDPDYDVREMALFALGANAYAPAVPRVVAIARGQVDARAGACADVHPDQLSFDELFSPRPDAAAAAAATAAAQRYAPPPDAVADLCLANLPEFHNELPVEGLVERCVAAGRDSSSTRSDEYGHGHGDRDGDDDRDHSPDLDDGGCDDPYCSNPYCELRDDGFDPDDDSPPPSREQRELALRGSAVMILDRFDDLRAVEALMEIAADPDEDPYLRHHAISGLGCVGHPSAKIVVERALHDPAVFDAAIEAIGGFGDPSVIPTLVGHLRSDDRYLRGLAVVGLGRLRHPDALRHLMRVMADRREDEWVRREAVVWLVNSDDLRVLEPLVEAVVDPDWEFRRFVLAELDRFCARMAQPEEPDSQTGEAKREHE
jgi:HEAT repeat protein